jgi:hypothetical protein
MTQLIDSYSNTTTEIKNEWWIKKPHLPSWTTRVKQAVLVLKGKAIAVHFKEDEI